jgi:hypothetical protein
LFWGRDVQSDAERDDPEANVRYADDGLQPVELGSHDGRRARKPPQHGLGHQELELLGRVVQEALALQLSGDDWVGVVAGAVVDTRAVAADPSA